MADVETPDVPTLYDGVPMYAGTAMTEDALKVYASLHGVSLSASTRPDMAGAPVTLYRPPITYQDKAIRMWEAYATDPLFRRLIDRLVDFAGNFSRWEVQEEPAAADQRAQPTWLERVRNWWSRKEGKANQAEEIWNAWYERINLDVPNTPQGGIQVTRWILKHMLLGAMAPIAWEWQPFQVGRRVLTMPTRFTVYPEASITLMRPTGLAIREDAYLFRPNLGAYAGLTQQLIQAPAVVQPGDPNVQLLPQIGLGTPRLGATEAFMLKYNYSPGDLATSRIGSYVATTWGPYPSPPFIALMPQFMLRQKLFAADLALADGVANYMKVYKIGTKEFPPREPVKRPDGSIEKEGTIGAMRKLIMEGMANPANAQFLPFWVDLEIKMPDAAILMSEEKYVASSLEILQAFGVFASRSQASRNEKFEKLNISGFEELLYGLQMHCRMFWERIAMRVIQANAAAFEDDESDETKRKRTPITRLPAWTPGPLNTKSDKFMEQLMELAKIGRISSQTLLLNHGLDSKTEQRRIAEDMATGADEIYDGNIPLGLVQETQVVADPDKPSPSDPPGDGTTPSPTGPKRVEQNEVFARRWRRWR